MKIKRLLLVAAFIAGGSMLMAQSDTSRVSYNLHFGNMDYSGDYATEFYSFNHGIAGGLGLAYYIGPSFDLTADLNYGRVRGDNTGPRRNKGLDTIYNFQANMGNFNVNLKYKFTNGYILKESASFSPYLVFGFGTIYSHSVGFGHMGDFTQNPEKVWAINLNVGAGLKYQINAHVGIFIQSMQLMPLVDRVDGWYINIPSNKKNDVFLMNAIGITINPGGTKTDESLRNKREIERIEKENRKLEKMNEQSKK
jgi:OmpA-OmpF porin, OOP family